MGWYAQFKQVLKAKSIFDAIKSLHGTGFSFKVAGLKMLRTIAWVSLGLVITHFASPDVLANLLGVLPDNLEKLLLPFVIAAMTSATNWYKNKNNEMVVVVPLGEPEATPIVVSVKPPVPPSTTPTIPQDSSGV